MSIRRFSQALYGEDPLCAAKSLGETEQREAVVFGRVWIWTLIVTIVFGVAALGVLAFNLVKLVLQIP